MLKISFYNLGENLNVVALLLMSISQLSQVLSPLRYESGKPSEGIKGIRGRKGGL